MTTRANCSAPRFLFGAAAALLWTSAPAGTTRSAAATPPATPPAPVAPDLNLWTTDPALLPQLAAAPTKFGRFTIRPPLAFKEKEEHSVNGLTNLYGFSTSFTDQEPPTFIVVGEAYPGEGGFKSRTPAELMEKFVGRIAYSKYQKNWYAGPVDDGMINGVKFVHQTWSGSEKANGVTVYGIAYGTFLRDGTFVFTMCQDNQPDDGGSLDLLNASLETLTVK